MTTHSGMKGKRVFLYVQHLLGIGHLQRTAALAKKLSANGAEVTLASGGYPVPDLDSGAVEYIQLPPAAAADLSFKTLVDLEGRPVNDAWKASRCERLLEAWRKCDPPHALVIELFPFGRRQMRFELDPLLQAATSAEQRPVIVSSVRDILGGGQGNPARQLEMLQRFEKDFDWLLVHADAEMVPFSRTFLYTDKLGSRLHYTGYVDHPPDPSRRKPKRMATEGLVVSAGGGAVGEKLLENAIRAHSLSSQSNMPCRILCGVNAPARQLERLAEIARLESKGNIIVERARSDFRDLLACCTVSVSQAGYNTMMDIVASETRAVVVPFAAGGETEQTVRARSFAELGMVEVLEESNLSPQTLADAIDRAALAKRPQNSKVDRNGTNRSAELLGEWMNALPW